MFYIFNELAEANSCPEFQYELFVDNNCFLKECGKHPFALEIEAVSTHGSRQQKTPINRLTDGRFN